MKKLATALPFLLLLASCTGHNAGLGNPDISAGCLLSGVDYVPGELVVLYPMEVVADPLFRPSNRAPVTAYITGTLNGTLITDTSVANTDPPPAGVLLLPPPENGGVNNAFDVFDFTLAPGEECDAIDSIIQANLFSGVCYLPASDTASCYWIASEVLVPNTSLGAIDTDGDGIPDVIDNCPESPNPGQKKNTGRLKGAACDFVLP